MSSKTKSPKSSTPAQEVEVMPNETGLAPSFVADITAINALHQQATDSADAARLKMEQASHFALLAGTRLIQLKDSLPHGAWGKLFSGRKNPNSAQNASSAEFGFSQDTASRYMEVAKRLPSECHLTGKARKQLAQIAAAPAIEEKDRELLNKLTGGRTLKQLYGDLDIITAKPSSTKPAAKGAVTTSAAAAPTKTQKQAALEDAREAIHGFRQSWEKLHRAGHLDDLHVDDLKSLDGFLAEAKTTVSSRLK